MLKFLVYLQLTKNAHRVRFNDICSIGSYITPRQRLWLRTKQEEGGRKMKQKPLFRGLKLIQLKVFSQKL